MLVLKIVLGLIVIAVIALVGLAATRPDKFEVKRTAIIKARPEALSAMVEDFHQWGLWSPWEKLDPDMARTYGGPAKGAGSTYAWSGKGKAGSGSMEITKVEPGREVMFDLHFLKPIKADNVGRFIFEPQGDATLVTWTMEGQSPFMAKLMGVFFDMDTLVGKDFEAGLANMKAEAEKQA